MSAQTTQSSNIVLSETGNADDWTDNLTFANYVTGSMTPVTTADFTTWYTTTADAKDAGIKGATNEFSSNVTANVDYTATKLYMKYESSDSNATKKVKVTLNVTDKNTPATSTEDFLRVALVPVGANAQSIQGSNIVYGTASDDFAKDKAAFTSLTADNTDKTITTTNSKELISNATLKANQEYQFNVYVWYEGTDPQCLDSKSLNNLGIGFEVAQAD
jgi:hypothetical protein